MQKIIHIEGMSCGHCTSSVEKALKAVAGVKNVKVDLASKSATVETDGKVSDEILGKAVTTIGFQVSGIQ